MDKTQFACFPEFIPGFVEQLIKIDGKLELLFFSMSTWRELSSNVYKAFITSRWVML